MFVSRNIFHVLRRVQLPSSTRRAISSTGCVYGMKSRWMAPLRRELFNRQERMERRGLTPTNIRSEYIDWNYDSELYAFGQRLQEEFNDTLLRQALTDSSYIEQETRRQQALGVDSPALYMNSNSELSSRGKGLIVDYAEKFLRSSLPLLPEEGVRNIVEHLTSVEVMSEVGYGIGLKDIILTEEYPPSSATVANAFQAIVAALNVSAGLDRCHLFVRDFVLTQLIGKDIYDIWKIEEPVNVLSDILMRSGQGEPEPRLLFQSGKNTIQSVYHVAMYSDKQFVGAGFGETITVAVEQAAWDALRRLFQITESRMPLSFGKDTEKTSFPNGKNLSLEDWSIHKARNIVMG